MKKLQWKKSDSGVWVSHIGGMRLRCLGCLASTHRCSWFPSVYFIGFGGASVSTRRGSHRYSLEKAKDDAAKMAEELLMDFYLGITKELEICKIEV